MVYASEVGGGGVSRRPDAEDKIGRIGASPGSISE